MKKEVERRITILRKDIDNDYYSEAHFVGIRFSDGSVDCFLRENIVWSTGKTVRDSFTQFKSSEEGNRVYREFINDKGYIVARRYTLDSKALSDLESLAREA